MFAEEQAFGAYRSDPSRDRLRALLRTQQDRVYNLCYQVLCHAQDAEDAAQKVLLKLVDGLGDLPDAAALRRWLYRVCVTTALDARTERSRRRAREREVALMKKTEAPAESEGEGDLLGAIGALDVELGDLILRHYFEKCTLKELAADQRVSEVAVWKRIEKGKERLRELLSTPGSAFSMATLDLRLSSIVPIRAPAGWVAALGAASKAGTGVPWAVGGLTVASTSGSTAKIVAVCVGFLVAGLGGGVYLGSTRARHDVPVARPSPSETSARSRRGEDVPAPPLETPAPSTAPAATIVAAPGKATGPAPAPAGSADAADASLREKLRKLVRISINAKSRDGRTGT